MTALEVKNLRKHYDKFELKDVSFKLPYLVGHSGNYDVQEAFAWIKAKLDANP